MSRRLEALRNLAERPGTEAEGRVARAMYEKAKGKRVGHPTKVYWDEVDILPERLMCDCGSRYWMFRGCTELAKHKLVREFGEVFFPPGTRIYYNCWAYAQNSPGVVVPSKTCDWNWMRIKFDHLKQPRKVPVFRKGKWLISTEPLSKETADELYHLV
jgi:hypothetical protein